tara:strand:+ start:52 stop:600 length:549 start_codon:yes stop_codon:yes gene_type:complete
MQLGMSVDNLKKFYMDFYNVTSTELDDGKGIHPCVYMHKSFFSYNNEYLPQDFCKGGKANSIYNRMRGQSQSGADVRLIWNIEVNTPADAKNLESKLQYFAHTFSVRRTEAFGSELYNLSVAQSVKLLHCFIDHYKLTDNPEVIRISIYNATERTVIFENTTQIIDLVAHKHCDNTYNNLFE